MKAIRSSYLIERPFPADTLEWLERAARTCYKSEGKIAKGSAEKLIRSVLKRGHESVIEHASMSVRFIVDRGVSHELVRHRLASFSQESTRYVRYSDEGMGDGVTFILPHFRDDEGLMRLWREQMCSAEGAYLRMLELGGAPEDARSVLPNSTKTEVVLTANAREWRHILRLRTAKAAHPQMREVMVPLLAECKATVPVLFEDLNP